MNNRQKLVQQKFLNNEEGVIRRLKQVYGQSLTDITEKIKKLQFDIGRLQAEYDWLDPDDPEKARVKSMIQSKIYQKRYQEQLQRQIDGIFNQMQTRQYVTVSDYLDDCYTDGFIGTIFDAHGQGVPIVVPIDQESMVRAVQLESKISKGLYTRLGEDVSLLKKKITAQVSRGIATGMTYAQVAKQLEQQSRIGFNRSARIARTEGHRIQTTAAMDAMGSAKAKGADVVKQWDATLDGRTRESHAQVDGEIREVDKPFSNGLMYPGDPSGGAAEVVNCRCALLQRAKWALDDAELETLQERAAYFGLDKTDQYDDFKKKYLKAADAPSVDVYSFTDDQREALQWYVSGEGQWINQYHRGRLGADFGELSDQERALSDLLDEATDRVLPAEITTLYRSVDAEAVFGEIDPLRFEALRSHLVYGDNQRYTLSQIDGLVDKTKHRVITEKGFMSTSKDYDLVSEWGGFTGSEKPVVLELEVPKGVKGADLKQFDVEGDEQFEVLLARGTRYEIMDITGKDGNIYVRARIRKET